MLKNPAYFHFYLNAAIVAFISAAFGFWVFQIWKLDLEPQKFPRHLIEMEFDATKHSVQVLSDFWNYWLRDGVLEDTLD